MECELGIGLDVGLPVPFEPRSTGQIELTLELMKVDLDTPGQPGLAPNGGDVRHSATRESFAYRWIHDL
jgi:hypothetical protein